MVGVVADAVTHCDFFIGEGVPGATFGFVTCGPSGGGVVVCVRVEKFDAGAAAVGLAGPLAAIEISDFIGRVAVGVFEDEVIATIAEASGEISDDGNARVSLSQSRGVFGYDEVFA